MNLSRSLWSTSLFLPDFDQVTLSLILLLEYACFQYSKPSQMGAPRYLLAHWDFIPSFPSNVCAPRHASMEVQSLEISEP